MELKIFQRGFNYSQDGPGNRLVYHLQGCNLFCPWCANPEGMSPKGTLYQNSDTLLDEHCPHGGIINGCLNRENCDACNSRECLNFLSSGLKLTYKSYTVTELVKEIESSRLMFFEGGGVTFTGGEATLQFDALKHILFQLKGRGINTALETNGTHPRLFELFELIDHLIMDIKHHDNVLHDKTVGGSLKQIKDNIVSAKKAGVDLLLRIPLICNFNASKDDAYAFAELFKELEVDRVELLKYHEFGKEKWHKCGKEYTVQNGFVSDAQFADFAEVLKSNNINCIRT